MGPLANEFLGIPDYDCNWLLHWCICWHSNNWIDLCRSGSTHVGYVCIVCIVFIRTHPTVSSCFHGHKCDCAWCTSDLSNELWMTTTIVQHLPYKSEPNRIIIMHGIQAIWYSYTHCATLQSMRGSYLNREMITVHIYSNCYISLWYMANLGSGNVWLHVHNESHYKCNIIIIDYRKWQHIATNYMVLPVMH